MAAPKRKYGQLEGGLGIRFALSSACSLQMCLHYSASASVDLVQGVQHCTDLRHR